MIFKSPSLFLYAAFMVLSRAPETLLSGVDERPDDLQVALLVLVRRLHGPQPAVVEDRHEEALRQVVQVLAKSEHVVAFTTCSSVYSATFHSGAEGTDRRTIALQCLSHDVLLLVQVMDAQLTKIWHKWSGVVSRAHWVNRHRAELEIDTLFLSIELILTDCVQQGEAVLASRQADQHLVPIAEHRELGHCLEERLEDLLARNFPLGCWKINHRFWGIRSFPSRNDTHSISTAVIKIALFCHFLVHLLITISFFIVKSNLYSFTVSKVVFELLLADVAICVTSSHRDHTFKAVNCDLLLDGITSIGNDCDSGGTVDSHTI